MLISGRLSATTLAHTGASLVTVQRREDFVNNGNEYGGESCKARDGCAIAADPSATLSSSSIPVDTSGEVRRQGSLRGCGKATSTLWYVQNGKVEKREADML